MNNSKTKLCWCMVLNNKQGKKNTFFIHPAFLAYQELHCWWIWICSWRTPLKATFGSSFSLLALTAGMTVKLCLSPPHNKIGFIRLPSEFQGSRGWQLKLHWSFVMFKMWLNSYAWRLWALSTRLLVGAGPKLFLLSLKQCGFFLVVVPSNRWLEIWIRAEFACL